MDKPITGMLFANGQVAIFDAKGQQIPLLQAGFMEMFAERATGLGFDISDLIIHDQFRRRWKLIRWTHDNESGWNFQEA